MSEVPSESSTLCAATLRDMAALGMLQEVIVCAGARNSAVVVALAAAGGVRLWQHFEERSAAFFALGRILSHGRPAVVVTTSGTAVAELFPAIIEAHYQGLPLIALTADRPASWRGTGAPQAIEQAGIFGKYPAISADVRTSADLAVLGQWPRHGPLHVNLCLEEPAPAQLDWLRMWGAGLITNQKPLPVQADPSPSPVAGLSESTRPLVLLGDLLPSEIPGVRKFLQNLGAPIYAEAASGLRGDSTLRRLLVTGGDAGLKSVPHHSVLRIGGVPACRFWRDLETRPDIPVLSLTRSGHRGLARDCEAARLCADALNALAFPTATEYSAGTGPNPQPALDACLARHPDSEPAQFRVLSEMIPADAILFTGNSMPIREWNLCAHPESPHHARALRGANGIDGNLSAFLGLAADAREAWGIVGDLTALYDASALWMLAQMECPVLRIVIIQNSGGKIFSRLPSLRNLTVNERRLMENPHQTSFHGWASQWGLAHRIHHGSLSSLPVLPDRVVLELHPDSAATESFWHDWGKATK